MHHLLPLLLLLLLLLLGVGPRTWCRSSGSRTWCCCFLTFCGLLHLVGLLLSQQLSFETRAIHLLSVIDSNQGCIGWLALAGAL